MSSSSPAAAYPTYASPPAACPNRMLSSSASTEPLAVRMLSPAASMERLPTAVMASTERLIQSSRMVSNGSRQLPITLSGVPPVTEMMEAVRGPGGRQQVVEVFSQPPPMTETMEMIRGPDGRQQVVEVFSQPPPITYAAAPKVVQRPAQRVEAIEVVRRPGIVEIVRDDAEVFALRAQLEEKTILVLEYQRRNNELQARKNEYTRLVADAEGEMSRSRTERVTLLNVIQENQAKITQLQAEIAMLIARNEELVAVNAEQAQRITALDCRVIDLELKNSQQQTEINALRKCNQELEQLAEQQADKIAELQRVVEDLKRRAVSPPPSPPASISDDERIDRRIKEYFRIHTDFQVATTKEERLGLYTFAKPISKKVNMKVVGEEVLARVGGGWEEVWEWLDSERLKFLEAKSLLCVTIRWQLPNDSQQDTTFTKVPMGFELQQDSEPATTETIARGGEAERLGIGAGWQVMAVNDQSVEGFSYQEVTKLIISSAKSVNPNASITTKRRSLTSTSSNGALRQSR